MLHFAFAVHVAVPPLWFDFATTIVPQPLPHTFQCCVESVVYVLGVVCPNALPYSTPHVLHFAFAVHVAVPPLWFDFATTIVPQPPLHTFQCCVVSVVYVLDAAWLPLVALHHLHFFI